MPTILITGASRGFGRALVDVYASRKWSLFPLVRDPRVADELARIYAPNCFPIVGDVAFDSVEGAITRELSAHADSLDLLVNNAGHIVKNRGVLGATSRDLQEHFNVHVVGAWRCTTAALPFLKKARRPVVVHTTSRFGSIGRTAGRRGELIYSYQIAKCGQNMLAACLDQELARDKIRAFAVHPGRLKTAAAAPDADTEPRIAAEKLYEWIDRVDDKTECKLYDLMRGNVLEW